jgi:hypothetical protein
VDYSGVVRDLGSVENGLLQDLVYIKERGERSAIVRLVPTSVFCIIYNTGTSRFIFKGPRIIVA